MADNVVLNLGVGGATVATDDDGTAQHQYVKLEFGPNNTQTKVEDADGSRLPVNVGQSAVIGATNEGAASSDTATTGLNGLFKRFLQRITTLWDEKSATLQASQVSATTNTTTSRTTTTGLGLYSEVELLINVTNGGASTGTLQLYLQDSFDGGTTWDDLVSSNTITFGAGASNQVFSISGKLATTKVQGSAAQQETLTAGQVRQGPWGDRIRVREKVSGVSGSPTGVTYTITAVFKR